MHLPRYRAAIIGTGRVGSALERDPLRAKPHSHAGWYAACPRTELVAGCDLDAGRLQAFGADWGLPGTALFTDYRRMLEHIRPDIVSICAYAADRRAMVEASAACGARALWIEKAVACSIAEADAMAETIRRHDIIAIVDQPRRGEARYAGVRELIDGGSWGRLQSVHCSMSGHLMHTGTHAWDVLGFWCGGWRAAAAWLGGGESTDIASLARHGAGSGEGDLPLTPLSPPGPRAGPDPSHSIADQGGHAHILFDDDVHAVVSGGLKRYFVFQFDLLFEGGRVRLGNDVDERLAPAPSPRYSGFLELTAAGPVPTAPAAPPMLTDLVDAMDSGREPWMSFRHAVAAFRLGIALFQSHLESHRYVRPDELQPDLYVASI